MSQTATPTKTRETRTPAQRLADLRAQVAGALLKREELDANLATYAVRIKRILQSNPDLVETPASAAE